MFLKNPHSILAACQCRPHEVKEIQIASDRISGVWNEVVQIAQSHNIPVNPRVEAPMEAESGRFRQPRLQRKTQNQAVVIEKKALPLEDLFAVSQTKHGIWLALDCLQDPQNVGALFRMAAFFGVQGLVMTRERSLPMTEVVYDVASGGVEYVPFCVTVNLQRAFEKAQQAGIWILGTSEHANEDFRRIPRDRSWLLVVGNEAQGLRSLTLNRCDQVCCILPQGPVQSLNVSVATGIVLQHLTQT